MSCPHFPLTLPPCSELHLLPPEDSKNTAGKKVPNSQSQRDPEKDLEEEKDKDPLSTTSGRLQSVPKPLEANHVVNLPKQLLALGIGHFPDGTPLKNIMVSFDNCIYLLHYESNTNPSHSIEQLQSAWIL